MILALELVTIYLENQPCEPIFLMHKESCFERTRKDVMGTQSPLGEIGDTLQGKLISVIFWCFELHS